MRQSSPISPYIVIITTEILGISIRRSDDVKGFKYKNAESKLNLNKSELIALGHSKVEIYTHNFSPGIKITTDKFKLLGIIIPTNGKQKDLIEDNYYNKKKILEIIKTWQKRDLTLYGKLTIIKSLIIPQLTYALTILPLPGEFFLSVCLTENHAKSQKI